MPAVELTNSVESSHEDDFYTYDKESQRMNISSKYRAKLSTLPRMEISTSSHGHALLLPDLAGTAPS